MTTSRRSTAMLAAFAASLLTAGCGSTVQGPAAANTVTGDELAVPGATSSAVAPTGPTDATSATISGTSGNIPTGTTQTSNSTNNSASAGTTSSGPSGVSGSPAVNGPGVTATTINVAGVYDPNASAENQALGAANQNPGDTRAAQEAVVNYINAHGGVAHRQVRLVWYAVDSSKSTTANDQAGCAAWTQDNKVFVLGSGDPILDQCATNAHALGLTEGIMGETTPTLRKYPTDVNITGFTTDHAFTATINGLAKQGYFSSGAKVGIATWDAPDYIYGITHGAQPALAAAGVRNVPVAYIAEPQSYGDLGATSAAISSAVLKFHSQGIDHVILLDGFAGAIGPGYLVLEWMTDAESQHWRPKYGLNSNSGFSTLAPNLPEKQMEGSIGVGWVPIADQAAADQQSWLHTSRARLCSKIMTDAGQPSATSNQKTLQFFYCDFFFFLKQALDPVSGPLNISTATVAIDAIGGGYEPLSTLGTLINADRHDGATLVRNIAFYPSCTCYRYTSSPYRPY